MNCRENCTAKKNKRSGQDANTCKIPKENEYSDPPAAQKAAHGKIPLLLIHLWEEASDAARLHALEILGSSARDALERRETPPGNSGS